MLATPAEALREFAWNAGMDRPEQEWLLHEWDVWVRNPHYTGKPGRHPEDDQDLYDEPDFDPENIYNSPGVRQSIEEDRK